MAAGSLFGIRGSLAVLPPQVSYVLTKLGGLELAAQANLRGEAACRKDAKRAARKSKRASNAPQRRFPQREIRRAATATRSCFISNGKFRRAKRSWHCMTHKRRVRPPPKRLEIPNYSHRPSRALLGRLLKDFRGVFEGLPRRPHVTSRLAPDTLRVA
jgi:hypothetical protein